MDAIVALDQAANGVGRRVLLQNLLGRPGTRAWMHAQANGFVFSRAGRVATHIGPLVAATPDDARTLLATALAHADGPVFLDVPQRWTELAAMLEAGGFTRQRPYVRMALGSALPLTCGDHVFVLAGPEYG